MHFAQIYRSILEIVQCIEIHLRWPIWVKKKCAAGQTQFVGVTGRLPSMMSRSK